MLVKRVNRHVSLWLSRIAVLQSLFLLSGCVGVSVIGSTSEEYRNYTFDSEVGYVRVGGRLEPVNKQDIVSKWDDPDEISVTEEGDLKWIYHREVAWNGVIVYAIVPLPLLIPTGYRDTEVIFNSSEVGAILYHKADSWDCIAYLLEFNHTVDWGGVVCELQKSPWKEN